MSDEAYIRAGHGSQESRGLSPRLVSRLEILLRKEAGGVYRTAMGPSVYDRIAKKKAVKK